MTIDGRDTTRILDQASFQTPTYLNFSRKLSNNHMIQESSKVVIVSSAYSLS